MKWLFWTIVHSATVVILASGIMTVVDVRSFNAQSNQARTVTVVESASHTVTKYALNPDEVNLTVLHDTINEVRKTYNLPPLGYSSELVELANTRASNMLDGAYYGHADSSGNTIVDLASSLGENIYVCENLALESTINEDTYVNDWLSSEKGHRECMLDPTIGSAGYATVKLFDTDLGPHNAVVAVYSSK